MYVRTCSLSDYRTVTTVTETVMMYALVYIPPEVMVEVAGGLGIVSDLDP